MGFSHLDFSFAKIAIADRVILVDYPPSGNCLSINTLSPIMPYSPPQLIT